MFSVPGWSVSADNLATQKSTKEDQQIQEKETGTGTGKGKKRKRDGEVHVTAGNLEKMWKKHFDLRNGGTGKKSKRKKEKAGLDGAAELDGRPLKGRNSYGTRKSLGGRELEESSTRASIDDEKVKGNKDIGITEIVEGTSKSGEQLVDAQETRSKKKKKPKKDHSDTQNTNASASTAQIAQSAIPTQQTPTKPQSSLTPLQQTMRSRLISARFRHLNETLYTKPSSEALSLFSTSPDLYADYHAGFALQVKESWPENPVDIYISNVRSRAKIPFKLGGRNDAIQKDSASLPLPRRPNGACSIADNGCGDAKLSRTLQPETKKLQLRFQNFDLHSQSSAVIKADIAALPLKDGEVDVAVFCLSLMGTNWIEFVEEAWRVLRGDGRGECWVSEVKSRFGRAAKGKLSHASISKRKEKQNKKKKVQQGSQEAESEMPDEAIYAEDDRSSETTDQTDISAFVDVFQRRGFTLRPESLDRRNTMFVSMVFVKAGVPSRGRWKGMKWTGARYERVGADGGVQKRFVEDEGDVGLSVEEEGRVLKPCVYKLR